MKLVFMIISGFFLQFCSCMTMPGLTGGTVDKAITGSVFLTFRTSSSRQCTRLCLYSSACASVNWMSTTRECQLNSQDENADGLEDSPFNIYLPIRRIQRQTSPCNGRPCTTGHMCVPVIKSTSHRCVPIGPYIYPPSTSEIPTQSTGITKATPEHLPTGTNEEQTATSGQATSTTEEVTATSDQTTAITELTATSDQATATTEDLTATSDQATATTEKRTATPSQATPTTEGITATSGQTTAITEGLTSTSDQTTATTEDLLATSDQATTTTEDLTATSDQATATTEDLTFTSDHATTTTGEIMATTDQATATTGEIMATTDQATATTEELVATSGQAMATTDELTTTFDQATVTIVTTAPTLTATCDSDSDCDLYPHTTCSGGLCTCQIGYDLDLVREVCRSLQECSSFGSDFTVYRSKFIHQHNVESINPSTESECSQVCLTASYTCKNFDMIQGGCYTQDVSWFEVSESERRSHSYYDADHYQRKCDW